ncbi:MAG: putative glycoside hydrolase [Labilithrix sp.]|nr:putative glycoside hydrolase [Labilithrix sp.]
MRRSSLFPVVALALAAVPLSFEAGCSAPDAGDGIDSTEQANTAEDLALAKQILTLLGGPNGKCRGCHTATPDNIRAWGKSMQAVDAACFAPATLTAEQRVNCLRTTPANATSAFSAHKLGLYAAGASLPQMQSIFQDAFPASQASAAFATFQQQAGMPRGRAPMSAADFAKVKGWVLRGMPQLDQAAGGPGDAGTDALGTIADANVDADAANANGCVDSTTPALATHITQMKTTGWAARLADQSTSMFGCGAATNPLACLTTLPDVTTQVGAASVNQKIRKLRQQPLASHYWVRSSADGRWVGFGLNPGAKVIDLSKPDTATPITIGADYDPFFLPSNDGFAFAGAHADNAIHVCRQSLLADAAALANPQVSLLEPKCTKLGADVYQSIGSALDGARYFVTVGAHENDDGGNEIVSPLPAAFTSTSKTKFVPMVNDGAAYRAEAAVNVTMPGEGDVMLSPSTKLLVARFSGGAKQGGYRVHAVDAQVTSSGATTVQTPLRAQVCMKGGKASFSFDERFLATHQYVDRTEPDQSALPQGSSNIVVADLATGTKVRLTKMAAGQYALYPHFRADGWLYFLVRDMNAHVEYIAATDAAVRMEGP